MYNDKLKSLPPVKGVSLKEGICHMLILTRYIEIQDIQKISNEERVKLLCEMHSFLKEKGWHSGCKNYPILSGKDDWNNNHRGAYIFNDNLWDIGTVFGQRRWETYLHLDQYLTKLRERKCTMTD